MDQIPKAVKGPDKTVRALLESRSQTDNFEEVIDVLELKQILDRDIEKLSGGELQRFAIAMTCVQQADV